VVVFAAASLRDVFSSLGKDFEKAHPGVEVSFHFAGTQELRTQLEQGAAVDVFASADMRHMNELQGAGLVAAPVVFARNEPVIVVSKESAGLVASVADLPKVSRLVVGAPEVPIGKYTQQILEKASGSLGSNFAARVEANIVSREMNVRQVLSKVSLGEAQAGVVYRTDALSAKEAVGVVAIPGEMNVLAEYPIAVTQAPPHPELARAWVELVRSEAGQKALAAAGFLAPLP
jgi:molybdate transport system substrate-binding protein